MAISPKLARQTAKTAGAPNGMRLATVTAVSTSGVTVDVNGAPLTNLAYLDSAPPNVGDTVSVFKQDQTWLVMGRASVANGQWGALTLANGFTSSGLAPSVRRTADNNLQVYAWLVSGATVASGTTVATVPGSFAPANSAHQPILAVPNLTASSAGTWCALVFNAATGLCELQLHGSWANGNVIFFNGFWPLDL